MPINKPPLGLTPRYIWLGLRLEDVKNAIERYRVAETEVPAKWLKELEWLEKLIEKG